jgi:Domain of unknown function (DUF4402)
MSAAFGTWLRIARAAVPAAALFSCAVGHAQLVDGARTTAEASIMPANIVSVTNDLGFSIMIPQAGSGGSISVAPNGVVAVTGGVTLTPSGGTGLRGGTASALTGATASATQIVIGGERGQIVSVAMSETLSASRVGGSETVSFTPTSDLRSEIGQLVGDGVANGGNLVFNIGGNTLIPGNLAPGDYNGLIFVLAQYN